MNKLMPYFSVNAGFFKILISLLAYALFPNQSIFSQHCDATFSVQESCNTVAFLPNASSNLNFLWDFGDGATSTESNPTHVYLVPEPGNYEYDVTLIVSGNCIPDTVQQVVSITVGALPMPMLNNNLIPAFTNCSASINNPNFELFVQNATVPDDNLLYHINWGDESAPFEDDAFNITSHLFTSTGLFDIAFTVTGNNQCIARATYEFFNGNTPGVGLSTASNTVSCIPATIEFPYNSSVLENPTGTTYTLFVNDGSADTIVIQHPPADDFFAHHFTSSPCDAGLNEYTVTMIAENACNTQTSTSTIKLDRGPVGGFEAAPNPVCPNEEVVITNTSEPGVYTANGQCRTDMSSYWSIRGGEEGTHFTITGNLGAYPFEPGDSSGFTVVFIRPGSYDILLSYGSASPSVCSRDTVIQTICVIEEPIPGIENTSGEGCAPRQIDFVNTSNTLQSCVPADYLWKVAPISSDCGDADNWTFVDTTTETSVDASIRFETSGTYEVTLVASNRCGTDSTSTLVEIGQNPSVTIMPIDTFCNEAEIFPRADSLTNCGGGTITYAWSFPTGMPTSSSAPNPGPIRFTQVGPHVITLTTTNDCGTSATQETLHLYAAPGVPGIRSNSPICTGEDLSLQLTDGPGGVAYQWGGPNNFSSTLANPVIQNATAINGGTYTLIVTDSLSRCTNQASLEVMVLDAGSVQITPGAPNICIGDSVTLAATGAGNYVWSPTDYLNTTSGPTVTVVPPSDLTPLPITLQYIVSGQNNNNGCSAIDTITLTINAPPVVSAGLPQSACAGVPLQLTGNPMNGDGGAGIWTGNEVNAAGSFNAGVPGNYTAAYVFTDDNSCQDSSSVNICVLAAPIAHFSVSNRTLCEGQIVATENLSGYEGACSGVSYLWDVENGGAECHPNNGMWNYESGDANSEAPTFQFLQSGTYQIILTVHSPCDTTTYTQEITVGEAPQVELAAIEDLCDTGHITPQIVHLQSCNSPVTYLWEFPGSDDDTTSNLPGPPTITYSEAGDYTIALTLTNTCSSASDTINFSILDGLATNFDIPSFACLGPDYSFTPNNTSTGDEPQYTWAINGPGSPTISDHTAEEPIITLFAPGQYIVGLTVSNAACQARIHRDTLQASAPPDITLAPLPTLCAGGSILPAATYYPAIDFIDTLSWGFTGGSGYTGDPADPGTIEYPTSGMYTITIQGQNACGSDSSAQTFEVLEAPQADAQLDTNFACLSEDLELQVTNLSSGGNPEYTWSISTPGTVGEANDYEPRFTMPATGWYTITLEANNGICPPSTWRDSILVETSPSIDLQSVGNFCDSTALFPLATISDTSRIDSIIWAFPGGTPDTSTNFYPGPVRYAGAGDYTYQATVYNACGSDADQLTFTIDTIPRIIFNPIDTICKSDGLYTIPEPAPPGGTWAGSAAITGPNPWHFDPGLLPPGDVLVTIYYEYTIGECTISTPKNIMVFDLNYISAAPNISTCIAVDSLAINNGSPSGGWYAGPGITDSLAGIFKPGLAGEGAHTLIYYYQLPNTECVGSDTFAITVHPLPQPTIQPLDSLCINTPQTILNGTTGMNTYEWHIGDSTYSAENPTYIFQDTGTVAITLIATSPAGCTDSTHTQAYISAPPSFAGFEVDDSRICPSAGVHFSPIAAIDPRSAYTWSFGRNPQDTIQNYLPPNPIIFENNTDSLLTYEVSLTIANECGALTQDTTITVVNNPWPQIGIDSSRVGCSPYTVLFTNRSAGDPDSCDWTFNNNPFLTSCQDTFSHTFYAEDTSTIISIALTVANECGDSTLLDSITVIPPGVQAFYNLDDPDFTVCPFDTLHFEDASTPIPTVWSWNFGDTHTSTQANPTHAFTTPDTTFYASLRVSTGCGSDEITRQIRVLPAPEVDFELPPFGCVNQEVTGIINLSPIDLSSYTWEFGNGAPGSAQYHPRPIFGAGGQSYPVTLTVEDFPNKCRNSLTKELLIREQPIADFAVIDDDTIGCQALSGKVESLAAFANQLLWNIDGRAISRNEVAGFSFGEPGRYPITLIASFDGICFDSLTQFIEVEACDVYIPNAFSPNEDGTNDFFTLFGGPNLEKIQLLQIFSRWGNMVFEKKDFDASIESEGWDGAFQGKLCNAGVYAYYAEVQFIGGVTKTFKGDVTLLAGRDK